jgi:predicted metalloprotease with PDZ domain
MEPVRYHVRIPDPKNHLFAVEARFPHAPAGEPLVLSLPVWTPGSYLVREFARHVEGVEAFDAAGKPLRVERHDKAGWRIERPAAPGPLTVRWRVYARELTVRTSYLDEDLAYFNGANLFLGHDEFRHAPALLAVDVPAGQRVVVGLPQVDGPGEYLADDYDVLLDAPVMISAGPVVEFAVRGVAHQLALSGPGNYDLDRLAKDLARIVEAEAALFGGLPYDRYAFQVLLTDKGRGGLEHLTSTSLIYPRNGFADPKSYEDFLELACHELFHAWNVKRIRPAALTPYDYRGEQYTKLLWAFEGFTSYYDTLLLQRAGVIDEARYLEKMGERGTDVQRTPGRQVASLDEASLVTWVKYYRPDESTPNTTVSYYVKGEVMAMLLDLTLRRETGNRRSLDDVMRLLWERHGRTGVGVPEEGVEAIAVEVGGEAIRGFFARHVRGLDELPYEEALRTAGLAVGRRRREGDKDKGGTPPKEPTKAAGVWLGANVREGDRPVVTHVFRNTPAEKAGLAPDDELVALGGEKLDAGWAARLEDWKPGSRVELHTFRRGRLRTATVEFAARPEDTLWFYRDAAATPEQLAVLASWLPRPV